jgi:hypothetical protein
VLSPEKTSGVVRVAEASTISMMVPKRDFSSRRPEAVLGKKITQDGVVEYPRMQERALINGVGATSFAMVPVSKLLVNPDQFWTQKSRMVVDRRGDALFGVRACDEWNGVFGCCGWKAEPGHLGLSWLGNGDPCECLDDCCPPRRNKVCKCAKCQQGQPTETDR